MADAFRRQNLGLKEGSAYRGNFGMSLDFVNFVGLGRGRR